MGDTQTVSSQGTLDDEEIDSICNEAFNNKRFVEIENDE